MKRHLVFTGLVRTPANFIEELSKAGEYRAEGLLDGIIWVTWAGELQNLAPDLRAALDKLEVTVVAAHQSSVGFRYGAGIWQLNQLATALTGLDGNDFVLKTRPDVVLPRERVIGFLSAAPHAPVSPWVTRDFGLRRKIATSWFRPSMMLTLCDLVYAGHVDDLRLLTNVSAALDFWKMTTRAVCHLGQLCHTAASLRDPLWLEWLKAFYPGSTDPELRHSSIRGFFRKRAAKMAFEWPDQYYAHLEAFLGDSDFFLYGFARYYAFMDDAVLLPEDPTVQRITFSGRQYCADVMQTASMEWPFCGLGGKRTVAELLHNPTDDPFLLRLRRLDPRAADAHQPEDRSVARRKVDALCTSFVRANFRPWFRVQFGKWKAGLFRRKTK